MRAVHGQMRAALQCGGTGAIAGRLRTAASHGGVRYRPKGSGSFDLSAGLSGALLCTSTRALRCSSSRLSAHHAILDGRSDMRRLLREISRSRSTRQRREGGEVRAPAPSPAVTATSSRRSSRRAERTRRTSATGNRSCRATSARCCGGCSPLVGVAVAQASHRRRLPGAWVRRCRLTLGRRIVELASRDGAAVKSVLLAAHLERAASAERGARRITGSRATHAWRPSRRSACWGCS